MQSIAIGLSYYQNVRELKRCMDSIPSRIPVIAIDGKYDNFNAPNDFSNDGSTELLLQYPNVMVDYFTGPQWQKRQRYLDIAAAMRYDFVFVVDSDEFIHPDFRDWDRFEKRLQYLAEKYPNEHTFYTYLYLGREYEKAHNVVPLGKFRKYPRLIREPATKKYDLEHHFLLTFKDDFTHKFLQARHIVEGVRLATDSTMRTPEFLRERDRWAYDGLLKENKKMARHVWDDILMPKAMATEVKE